MTVDVSHTSSWPVQVAARQRRLRVVNIAVGLTLALEGVLMLMLSNTLALPITASYLTNDPVAVRGPTMPERLFALLIGLFVGIRDLAAVTAIFAANTAMILFGLLMERQQQPGSADWSAFWFGSLVGVVPWVLVGIYVAGAPQVPGFVYAITATQFVLFFSFALNNGLAVPTGGALA